MDKTDCYKCNREPSAECGMCAVWLADEEVSKKERIAYQQGAKDFAEWLANGCAFMRRFGEDNMYTVDELISKWQKANEVEE